jgi:hypothetical protein
VPEKDDAQGRHGWNSQSSMRFRPVIFSDEPTSAPKPDWSAKTGAIPLLLSDVAHLRKRVTSTED